MIMENNLYFYLSKLILEYFLKGVIQSGDRYQIYFENPEDVSGLYKCLRIFAEGGWANEVGVSEFQLNNYNSYYLQFNDKKLVVAYHEKGDLLTGLRNNFDKVEGFTADAGILFIHNTELESITKGAESFTSKGMPLHIDSVRENIITTFGEEEDNQFTKSQKEFLRQLLSLDSFDYQIESTSLFDLKKYLDILNKKELLKADYNGLGVFFDELVHGSQVAKSQIKLRLARNAKWFAEICQNEQLGTLKDYLEKNFDKEGQRKLIEPSNWPEISYEDIVKFADNRDNIKFNEYEPITSELTEEGKVIWDKADGSSKAKKQNRNIIVFNPDGDRQVTIQLSFKKRPALKFLSHHQAILPESSNTFQITFDTVKPNDFNYFLVTYTEVKDGKNNYHNFKILIVPFEDTLFLGVKALYRLQRQKMGIEFHSDSELIFNDQGTAAAPVTFAPNTRYAIEEGYQLALDLSELNVTDTPEFPFTLAYKGATMFAQVNINAVKPQPLFGWPLWRKKMTTGKSVFYSKKVDDKGMVTVSLEHGNQIFYAQGDFKENLLLEEQLIESGFPIHTLTEAGELYGEETNLPAEIRDIYDDIIKYYRDNHKGRYMLLPSTTYINADLKILYTRYVQVYYHLIGRIAHNDVLSSEILALLRIGTIQEESGLHQWKFSPLHPLVVAYQLKAMEKMQGEDIPAKILSKFTAVNLLPFINNGTSVKDYFIGVDQEHSPEWIYYVNAQMEGQSINRKNAPEIISSKIHEFIKHFSFLYLDHESPIRLNLVNVGNGKEALQGIFHYLTESIKALSAAGKNPLEVHPVLLNIYGSGNYVTKFEQFSKFDNVRDILKEFDIDLNKTKDVIDPQDLLRLYHERVQFFIKELVSEDEPYEYAHITFHQFHEKDLEKADNNTQEVSTGISLEGIFSDLPSIFNHGNYRTGFGLRSLPEEVPNLLIDISKKLNEIGHVAGTSSLFKDHFAFASVINNNVRSKLARVYDSSQWITFINPMVDLSFFKDDKEVVIIHYTDHYGNASGYDSITITTQWKPYKFILEEFLSGKVDHAADHIKPIINMFNAINGYWLLKLGSQNVTEMIEKEKISILSAVKEMLAILDHPKITWVVLSLEEILRVTGSAGLAQTEGLFSTKNLNKSGTFSDDLLLVGLETTDDELQLYFYPVEVKIGNNIKSTINKGVGQGQNTYQLLMETLSQAGLTGAIYRNYFAKLILTGAQKLALYNVWPGYTEKWQNVELLRGKLLNDQFKIGTLKNYVGHFGVMSFRNNEYKDRSITYINKAEPYLLISLYQSDGLNDLAESVDSLKTRYTADSAVGIVSEDLLGYTYDLDEATILTRNASGLDEEPEDETTVADVGPPADDPEPDELPEDDDTEGGAPVPQSDPVPFSPAFPAVAIESAGPLKILFGSKASDHKPIEWFPTSTDKVMHTNTGIIGTMGTGKTQFTKSLITQLYQNTGNNVDGKKIGVLIFDYKGDYIKDDFKNATDAKIYQLHHLPYNPLALFIDKTPKKLLPLHTASTLQDTISKAFNLGNKQRALLKELIMSAYSDAGIYRADEASWKNTAPTIADVCELYLNDENSSIDSLHAVLKELYDFEIFEPHGNKAVGLFDLLDGVTVIDLSGYNSELQNLVVAITLDLFYSQMQNQGHSKIDGNFRQINKIVLVDEADNFLSKNFESLRKILKEGREYGVGTILSTQFLNHFATSDNEYSNYILTWIIHRVNEIKEKEVGSLFDLPNKSDRDDLIGVIKSLEKHYSIVNLAGSKPIKIKDKAFWELIQ
jgi:DNA phosphorothioation-dependent restriction protein DptH